jgi:hypothetical protein
MFNTSMKTNTPKIIALAGPKGVGKSFVAAQLAKTLGATILSYADPIRAALSAIGVNFDNKEDIQQPFGVSARYMAQTFGTDWGRNTVSDSIWLDLMEKSINNTDGIIIIDDLRFDNEAWQVRRLCGIVIELHGSTRYDGVDSHQSEFGIDPTLVDRYFYNSRNVPMKATEMILDLFNLKKTKLQEWEDSQLYD